jgi:peroxiredoxin
LLHTGIELLNKLLKKLKGEATIMPKDSIAQETKTLKVGDMAPDFTLPAARGTADTDTLTLSDYRGKKNVVLAFYPFAFTPV